LETLALVAEPITVEPFLTVNVTLPELTVEVDVTDALSETDVSP